MATIPTPTPPRQSAIDGSPNRPSPDPHGSNRIRRTDPHPVKVRRSRAGSAWVGICIAALVLVALIIFMLQNTQPALVSFLGMQGSVPLAVALLIAGVGVGIIALAIGTIRITQLRRRLRDDNGGAR
ncbi:lipopolysaccharide assembly LapA domain-containing protein [Myceligenerans pegani]|uniref:DUF1049 domain-containing protein n=1 Tax=Myceligenerans pegani TaxID=2776917 RepID=A0ABR9N5A9_9MICO|nr:LapA family protein [Myceligenerans sp. TRM 65318]MBE1878853.1 DUF1049 domain-containing protein [Myceligenerans sp. TRM 65318]MBE3021124.1 DUF1049 domain-containing protein [Myceligenerans sp. TRM 65318]